MAGDVTDSSVCVCVFVCNRCRPLVIRAQAAPAVAVQSGAVRLSTAPPPTAPPTRVRPPQLD